MRLKLDPKIKRLLNDAGLPWEIDLTTKHYQLRIAGRLVVTLPQNYSSGPKRTQMNAVCAVRRFLRSQVNV